MKDKGGYLIAAVAIVIAIASLSLRWPILRRSADRAGSFNFMEEIGRAIAAYAAEHNDSLPVRISELVPRSFEDTKRLRALVTKEAWHFDITIHKPLIDAFCVYDFMRFPDRRILVFERPGVGDKGMVLYCLLAPDGQAIGGFSECYVPADEFARRILDGFPDHAVALHYQDTRSTKFGSNEYELDFKGEELHSLHQAFLASAKPPISIAVAHDKVQSAMDRLDGAGVWKVDGGISTSDGSTPFYRFNCYFTKNDPDDDHSITALVLFDGAVVSPTKTKLAVGK
jgi:hypothetical protein